MTRISRQNNSIKYEILGWIIALRSLTVITEPLLRFHRRQPPSHVSGARNCNTTDPVHRELWAVQSTFWDYVNSGRRVVLALLDPYADARTTEYKEWLCNTAYKNKK